MKRFTLILEALPGNIPEALTASIRKVSGAGIPLELPAILGEHLEEKEAAAVSKELESFGAEVELVPEESIDTSELDGMSLQDLSLALDREIEALKGELEPGLELPAAGEPTSNTNPAPAPHELSFEPLAGAQPGKSFLPAPTKPSLPGQSSSPAFELSLNEASAEPELLEERHEAAPVTMDLTAEDFSISFDEAASSHVDQGPVQVETHDLARPPGDDSKPAVDIAKAYKRDFSAFAGESGRETALLGGTEPGAEEYDTEEYDEDGGFEDEEERSQKLIFGAIAGGILLLIVAGWFLLGGKSANDGTQISGDIVQALLDEQDRLMRDERRKRFEAEHPAQEKPSEIFNGTLEFGPFRGEMRFGKYNSGTVLDSVRFGEPAREKLTPLELGKGLLPRPWIKQVTFNPPQPMTLGASSTSHGDALAYVEDDLGTLRVPVELEMHCVSNGEFSLKCHLRLNNRGADLKDELLVKRDAQLGFKIAVGGEFSTQPVSTNAKNP